MLVSLVDLESCDSLVVVAAAVARVLLSYVVSRVGAVERKKTRGNAIETSKSGEAATDKDQ